jgi:hypothetical protein
MREISGPEKPVKRHARPVFISYKKSAGAVGRGFHHDDEVRMAKYTEMNVSSKEIIP